MLISVTLKPMRQIHNSVGKARTCQSAQEFYIKAASGEAGSTQPADEHTAGKHHLRACRGRSREDREGKGTPSQWVGRKGGACQGDKVGDRTPMPACANSEKPAS